MIDPVRTATHSERFASPGETGRLAVNKAAALVSALSSALAGAKGGKLADHAADDLYGMFQEASTQSAFEQYFGDLSNLDYESVTSTKSAAVKVQCEDSMYSKVRDVLLQGSAPELSRSLQATVTGPCVSGKACFYGCVQLLLWMRHTAVSAALAEQGEGQGSASSLGPLVKQTLGEVLMDIGALHVTAAGQAWSDSDGSTGGTAAAGAGAARQPQVTWMQPLCLLAERACSVEVVVRVPRGGPLECPLRVLVLGESGEVVADLDDVETESEAAGGLRVRFLSPSLPPGFAQLLLLPRDAPATWHTLLPMLCLEQSAAQQLDQLFESMVQHTQQRLPENISKSVQATVQESAWQKMQALVADVAFVLEGRPQIVAALQQRHAVQASSPVIDVLVQAPGGSDEDAAPIDTVPSPPQGSSTAGVENDDQAVEGEELLRIFLRLLTFLTRQGQRGLFCMVLERIGEGGAAVAAPQQDKHALLEQQQEEGAAGVRSQPAAADAQGATAQLEGGPVVAGSIDDADKSAASLMKLSIDALATGQTTAGTSGAVPQATQPGQPAVVAKSLTTGQSPLKPSHASEVKTQLEQQAQMFETANGGSGDDEKPWKASGSWGDAAKPWKANGAPLVSSDPMLTGMEAEALAERSRQQPLWHAALFDFVDPRREAAYEAVVAAGSTFADGLQAVMQVTVIAGLISEVQREGFGRQTAAGFLHIFTALAAVMLLLIRYLGFKGQRQARARALIYQAQDVLVSSWFVLAYFLDWPLTGTLEDLIIKRPVMWAVFAGGLRPMIYRVKPRHHLIQLSGYFMIGVLNWRHHPERSVWQILMVMIGMAAPLYIITVIYEMRSRWAFLRHTKKVA